MMEKTMEATIANWGFMGIMEKWKMKWKLLHYNRLHIGVIGYTRVKGTEVGSPFNWAIPRWAFFCASGMHPKPVVYLLFLA